jgi:outer membrane protein W
MRNQHIVLAAVLILAALSTEVQAKDASWTLRVHGAIVESSAGDQASVQNGVSSSVDVGGGFGIGAEYRFSDRLGFEFSALIAGLEVGSSVSGRTFEARSFESSMMPLTFAVPFHFDTGTRADLFVAPTFSIVRYLDVETTVGGASVGTRVDVDSDAALGAALGVDVPFGKGKWCFSTGVRYMKTKVENTDVDPVIVTVGVAYRF